LVSSQGESVQSGWLSQTARSSGAFTVAEFCEQGGSVLNLWNE
jgi:hypothetical protein